MSAAFAEGEATWTWRGVYDDTLCFFGQVFDAEDNLCPPKDSSPSLYLIESTQRTNNTAGYALQLRHWIEDDAEGARLNILLTAFTPRLESRSILEMYLAFKDKNNSTETKDFYDTVSCVVEYFGDEQLPNMIYETFDFYGDKLLHEAPSGTYFTSVKSHLDTERSPIEGMKGTSSWKVNNTESVNSCNQSYCSYKCLISRPLDN